MANVQLLLHMQLLAVLLLAALCCVVQTAVGTSTSSAQESATLPPELSSLKSPLAASDAAKYAELYRRTGSVGDLCQTGHLYCDAQAFEAYYEKVLKPDQSVEVRDVVVYFRESELFADHRLTIVDQRLQSTAIERNRQTLSSSSNDTVSKYTYINVTKMPKRAFLPAVLARTLPFGTDSVGHLLTTTFNIDKSSALAKESAKTVSLCTDALRMDGTSPLRGEVAVCTTSLESLQSLVHSSMFLGPDTAVEALTTDSHLAAGTITGQVLDVELKASETSRHAVCHNLMYPSSVYFCHYLPSTRVYGVTLRAPDDSILHSVAMCHLDTNGWNPQHLAFQNLRTVPGQSEACHWVLQGSVTFVPA